MSPIDSKVKSKKDLNHSSALKKMESTNKPGAEASAWNNLTGVVKKTNSEGYRIPKKMTNRTPANPPVKKVASFGEHLIALEANRRLKATQARRIRRGSTDCSPRSDTSSCSSNISPVGQTQSTFAIRKQVEKAATTFERQLAAFDVHSKTSRSSSSSGLHKSSSSGQHLSISRHHSSGSGLHKSSSSGQHSSISRHHSSGSGLHKSSSSRHHSSSRNSESSSGSKLSKPETTHSGKSSHDKEGDKTSRKRQEDESNKTSRKRHRSSSKSDKSKREKLSEEKVEPIAKSGMSESTKTEKSDKSSTREKFETAKTEKSDKNSSREKKQHERSESTKTDKKELTSEKKDRSERETVEKKSSKRSSSISSRSERNKSQSEKRHRSPSVSKNSTSLQKIESKKTEKDSTERGRSRKSSGSSATKSRQSQASTDEKNLNLQSIETEVAQPSIRSIETEVVERKPEESLNVVPDSAANQKTEEVQKPEEKKIVFKFKLNPQQRQALKDQASVPEAAVKEPLPEPSVDVRERLDALKAFRQQFPKPDVVALSQATKPEVSFLAPGPVAAAHPWLKPLSLNEIFVPPPMLSDLEDSDDEDESKNFPKDYLIYTPPPMLSDLEDSDNENDEQFQLSNLSKKSKVDLTKVVEKPVNVVVVSKEVDLLKNSTSQQPAKTDALFNLRNFFSNKPKSGCDVVEKTETDATSSSVVVSKVEKSERKPNDDAKKRKNSRNSDDAKEKDQISEKIVTSKTDKSSQSIAEDVKPIEVSKESKRDGHRRREKRRSRHDSKREDSRRHKDDKKSRTEGKRPKSVKDARPSHDVLNDVVEKPKLECNVHRESNDAFSDSDSDDIPKYDVYSLARLFQGQVTENFRVLNAELLLEPAVDTDEADNELYCVCRSRNDVTRPMVLCENCNNWFHFLCVGYYPLPHELEESYICPMCSSRRS